MPKWKLRSASCGKDCILTSTGKQLWTSYFSAHACLQLLASHQYYFFTTPICSIPGHRAVDDLYTLAEMDGNLWQARNIVQLLDESTADFRQVSS